MKLVAQLFSVQFAKEAQRTDKQEVTLINHFCNATRTHTHARTHATHTDAYKHLQWKNRDVRLANFLYTHMHPVLPIAVPPHNTQLLLQHTRVTLFNYIRSISKSSFLTPPPNSALFSTCPCFPSTHTLFLFKNTYR